MGPLMGAAGGWVHWGGRGETGRGAGEGVRVHPLRRVRGKGSPTEWREGGGGGRVRVPLRGG